MAAAPLETPRWVEVVTVVAVSVVAVVAAIASYAHVYELAERAGEDWRAVLTPLSVDGMLVAAGMVMLVRRRSRQPAGWLPWTGLVLGIVASIAANVAGKHPEWDSPFLFAVVAAWPAVALAISFELLILVLRYRPARVKEPVVEQPVAEPAETPEVEPAPRNPNPKPRPGRVSPPSVPAGPTPVQAVNGKPQPLSAAERQRRYRARKREQAQQAEQEMAA